MNPIYLTLIVLHALALILVLIGLGMQVPKLATGEARVTRLALVSAAVLVVSGVGLTMYITQTGDPNWPKLTVKLLIGLVIAFGLYVHRGVTLSKPVVYAMIAMVLANAAVAMLW